METTKDVKIYYTKARSKFSFLKTHMMEVFNKNDEIEEEYAMPTEKDLEEEYVKVADFEFGRGDVPYHIHQNFNERDSDWDLQMCEALFYYFNHVDYEGVTANMASQDFIRENKLHTSMSIGDVVQIGENYYYVDAVGFEQFDPTGENVLMT